VLDAVAVGVEAGEVSFGWEPTGRYGGIGIETGSSIMVQCTKANDVLAEIINKHGHIDALKIDIESFEKEIISAIPMELKRKIRTIFVEQKYDHNPYPDLYHLEQYGSVARFFLIAQA
jgi:FkbM family methyltransferase